MAASIAATSSSAPIRATGLHCTTPPPSLLHLRTPPPPPNGKANHGIRSRRRLRLINPSCSSCSPSVTTTSTTRSPTDLPVSVSPREEEEICGGPLDANILTRRRDFVFMAVLSQLFCRAEGSRASAKGLDSDEASIIRGEVIKFLSKAKAAGVLRLAFHDAGTFKIRGNTGGMNGSIIYELDRLENAGLARSVKVLKKSKEELDKILSVSWADLIAVAGSEAVSLCGGPLIPVRTGRIDARIPDRPDQLPQESLNAVGLKKCFLRMGFSTRELVALSGAHTLGGKGFGNPLSFDNSYYKILLEKPWTKSGAMASMIGLPSDHALVEDDECLRWIQTYADDQAKFFDDFSLAYIKLVDSGASWR